MNLNEFTTFTTIYVHEQKKNVFWAETKLFFNALAYELLSGSIQLT